MTKRPESIGWATTWARSDGSLRLAMLLTMPRCSRRAITPSMEGSGSGSRSSEPSAATPGHSVLSRSQTTHLIRRSAVTDLAGFTGWREGIAGGRAVRVGRSAIAAAHHAAHAGVGRLEAVAYNFE